MDDRHTIYLNMCHHYRKIFNAKSRVDTSLPKTLRKKTNYLGKQGISPLLVTSIKNCTSHSTLKPVWKKNESPKICPNFYQHHLKNTEKNYRNKPFSVLKKSFNMNTSKSNATSKLHNLNACHPLQKEKSIKSNNKLLNCNGQTGEQIPGHSCLKSNIKVEKSPSLSVCENNYSEESSEDSAYNEGEWILSSNSRRSTPQILSRKNQLKQKSLETINKDKIIRKIVPAQKNKDDVKYIQFLKEITSDILQKNILTNKAIRTIFQHHMALNKYHLNMDKMVEEITKLQKCLGVPEDDQHDNENYGLGKDSQNEEIFEEKEEFVNYTTNNTELTDNSQHEKDHTNTHKSQPKVEEYDLDYSDSFSDVSLSDAEKTENDRNIDSEEGDSESQELEENSISDNVESYCGRSSTDNPEADSINETLQTS